MNTLNPKEISIIQMALQRLIEDNEKISKDYTLPFTAEARMILKDMLVTARSALTKIAKVSGHLVKMDEYKAGDEDDFLTKQS